MDGIQVRCQWSIDDTEMEVNAEMMEEIKRKMDEQILRAIHEHVKQDEQDNEILPILTV